MINTQVRIDGTSSDYQPAVVANGNGYVIAWMSASDDTIWWDTVSLNQSKDGYDFGRPAQIGRSIATTQGAPALANMGGKVWMAWRNDVTDGKAPPPVVMVSSLGGTTWSTPKPVWDSINEGFWTAGQYGSGASSQPALTATDSELFVAWTQIVVNPPGAVREIDNDIFFSKSRDGVAWSTPTKVPDAGTPSTPALAAFNGQVYMAWKGESDNRIWFARYSDDNGWSEAAMLPNYLTTQEPALGTGDSGTVHLVWQGQSDTNIWTATLAHGSTWSPHSPGTGWSTQAKIPVVETSTQPTLASQLSAATDILLAWKGATTTNLFIGPVDALELNQVQTYNLGIDNVNVVTQRTPNRESDTDYLTISVAVGKQPVLKKTIALGDHSYGDSFNPNAIVSATVADDEVVTFTYIMLNAGGSASAVISGLESTGKAFATAVGAVAITAVDVAANAVVDTALTVVLPGVGDVLVPLADSALVVAGAWLFKEFESLLSLIAPDCDGPVAAGAHAFTGAQLRARTASGTDKCVGVNSPSGCGDNSLYDVTWTIAPA